MSNIKQKHKDIQEYPHVKRNWLKAIKEIRTGGGITEHEYMPTKHNFGGWIKAEDLWRNFRMVTLRPRVE